ncbi:MAG: MmgE/PrpD family protein [Gemmatimonadota bacterium]
MISDGMTIAQHLARFAVRASWHDLSQPAREQLKIRVLDSLACAIGALDGPPIQKVRALVQELDGSGPCSLIGGGTASPDRAAFHNAALVRYLDFNDSYLAKGETCHPSDNFGAVLAAAEYADAHGRDLLTALAVAYQVQCRLSDVAPVRDAGFDHVTQGTYAVAAGTARALGLAEDQAANAIAIAGTAFNALRVTRTGRLSHWKGLAYPSMAGAALGTTLLAARGVTGPLEVFEGEKGFMDAVAGCFELDWDAEGLDVVTQTILKTFNAEIHSQSVLAATLDLREQGHLCGAEVEKVEVDVFDVAFRIIGGGEEGDKMVVHTKEEADHSLPYLVAVALLDGQVLPSQYLPARIVADDVQALLRRVVVRADADFSRRFPTEMPCRVRLTCRDGRVLTAARSDYPGFLASGQTWTAACDKLERLAGPCTSAAVRDELASVVSRLDEVVTTELTHVLATVQPIGTQVARQGGI